MYYRRMLSLAVLDANHVEEGREVEVLWGSPGTRQLRIRATVARYPYLDLPFNSGIDVRTIG